MEKLRAENTKLQEQLEIHEINKEQMHMRVWLKNSEIMAVYIRVSKSIIGFASTALHDCRKIFAQFFQPIVTHSHSFSRALRQLHAITSVSFVIG